ncbi:hypothetical protein NP233_g1699 [Leucocoprinus birnbaumii]|uniref:Uncharacterized protein n=1 Tax=Leucocoprinus birnbaumii TaxID=56174 RepID=A0AAD5W1N0_9AGAR|nr:hypothetical protein NP233_g1699 [Leucocoprinus birnbaumii]
MASLYKPRKLSVVIPPTPTSAQMASETAVEGGQLYSQLVYQPYRSPVSPLRHPYRPQRPAEPEPGSKKFAVPSFEGAHFKIQADDIASKELLAVANLMSSMKETLNHMTRAFDALGEQSQRLSSLPTEVKRVEEIRAAKAELEELIEKQKARMQELRVRLEGDVRAAVESKLRERLASMIHDRVADEVKERVRQELVIQIPRKLRDEIVTNHVLSQVEPARQEEDYQSDPDTPLLSPEDLQVEQFPRIPILLFHGPTDEEEDYGTFHGWHNGVKSANSTPQFSCRDDSHVPVRMPIMLFDESQEHEPPPPSPIPMAGPLRPLLRPMPSPEQSPAYVVRNSLESRCASGCATPLTSYPGVPAPTPITNEPIIMVYPLKSAPVSALSPLSEVASPLAPRDHNLLFALSSERNRELLRSQDLDGFIMPTPMAEWPKTRTIIKTPARSMQSSPLIVPPPLEPKIMPSKHIHLEESLTPETSVLVVPPPRRPELRARSSSLANNLKLLPPLVIS